MAGGLNLAWWATDVVQIRAREGKWEDKSELQNSNVIRQALKWNPWGTGLRHNVPTIGEKQK